MNAYAFAALVLLVAGPVSAAEGPWIKEEGVAFRLVSREDGVGDQSELMFGLQVRLERGWKFFWRAPGKFGLTPSFAFDGSTNISDAVVLWPTPRRLVLVKETGDSAVGYDSEVLLPIRVYPARTNAAIELQVEMEYGVCGEMCTGGRLPLRLALPAAGAPRSRSAELVDTFLNRVPRTMAADTVRASRDGTALIVEISGAGKLAKPELFVDGGYGRHYGRPNVRFSSDRTRATFRIPLEMVAPDAVPDSGQVALVLIDGGKARMTEVTVSR
jgi:suppressor for copper-sensitivity B